MIIVQLGFAAAAACDWMSGRTTKTPAPMSATTSVTPTPISINGEKRRLLRMLRDEFNLFEEGRVFVSISLKTPFRSFTRQRLYVSKLPSLRMLVRLYKCYCANQDELNAGMCTLVPTGIQLVSNDTEKDTLPGREIVNLHRNSSICLPLLTFVAL